jgi:hypothetical protein
MKITVFRGVSLCNSVNAYRHLGETLCLKKEKQKYKRGKSSVLKVHLRAQAGDLIRTEAVSRQAVPPQNFFSAYANTVPSEHCPPEILLHS